MPPAAPPAARPSAPRPPVARPSAVRADLGRIVPVILAGGAGTRLWPASRAARPKPVAAPMGEGPTLLQRTASRLAAAGLAAPVVVAPEAVRFVVAGQLAAAGHAPRALLVEPDPRGTAAAALAGTLRAVADDPEAVVLIAPSDHAVRDPDAFAAALAAALPSAEAGEVVCFGVRPDRAETGYGYLALRRGATEGVAAALAGFVEKPGAADAARMAADGRHLWNAGLFLASGRALADAFARHAPDLRAGVGAAVGGARAEQGFERLPDGTWRALRDPSIDVAVMEPLAAAGGVSAVPLDAGWSDLGDWDAVWRTERHDADGVAMVGDALAVDCRDTLLRAEGTGQRIVALGLRDAVVVTTPDAVLVADRSRAQEVRGVVEALRAEGAAEADAFPRDERPWGHFERVAAGPRFQVKRIVVAPGAVLSLQSHHHRAEHWIVVQGTGRVTVGDAVRLVSEGESAHVPLGAVHRLENPGRVELVLIEVQTGAYLGEDDIVRHADVYARD
ncbi:mannose-1-phosphate guanylyltransferase/mannose-6-phosphate isomerase [Jannaschia sp. Os4]|uniref:mannose-1-phosphate guanylyltransferase/mannose-6-phosphate isomerase n=1 Tax=Jannaschia sp. Os4 TaxID=2807617 RepID=UPI00193A4729|nr:mannose-1-phosphate guanylyltransferase/mannose-6-phosphate isomerase [Jannaschia sp. Os4]MBM2577390.1 mannose-1-phosphate guanylyltransferase/mannose-6-phosphate isomerase [Jannaschia sp. Os4]